jgi:hypothetical protein
MRRVVGRCSFRFDRFPGQQRCDNADQNECRHRDKSRAVGSLFVEPESDEATHQEQRAGARNQHRDAIGGDVRRHAGGLLVLGQAFDAERIDDNVLRGRGGCDQQGCAGDKPWRRGRVVDRKQYDRDEQKDLRQHKPPAAPPEQAREQGDIKCVDCWRPQRLRPIRRSHGCEQADRPDVHAGFRHPGLQRLPGK